MPIRWLVVVGCCFVWKRRHHDRLGLGVFGIGMDVVKLFTGRETWKNHRSTTTIVGNLMVPCFFSGDWDGTKKWEFEENVVNRWVQLREGGLIGTQKVEWKLWIVVSKLKPKKSRFCLLESVPYGHRVIICVILCHRLEVEKSPHNRTIVRGNTTPPSKFMMVRNMYVYGHKRWEKSRGGGGRSGT